MKEEKWVQQEYKVHLVKLESWGQRVYLVNWDRKEQEDLRATQDYQATPDFLAKLEMMEKGVHQVFPEI